MSSVVRTLRESGKCGGWEPLRASVQARKCRVLVGREKQELFPLFFPFTHKALPANSAARTLLHENLQVKLIILTPGLHSG